VPFGGIQWNDHDSSTARIVRQFVSLLEDPPGSCPRAWCNRRPPRRAR
jgi:hypothetical protein